MAIYRLGRSVRFPDPSEAEETGLLAVGGDLSPERLLAAYANGIFPWYEEPPILWFSPSERAALVPADMHVPRRLERTLRQDRFGVSLDRAFGAVIRACAETSRPGQRGTWITREMIEGYERLHALGFAHSCEAWLGDDLVGGVYGVSLGSVFFGESMFFRERDASKVAWVRLVRQLAAWDFSLFDCQVMNAHLARFGVRSIDRDRYLELLAGGLRAPTRRGAWRLGDTGESAIPGGRTTAAD